MVLGYYFTAGPQSVTYGMGIWGTGCDIFCRKMVVNSMQGLWLLEKQARGSSLSGMPGWKAKAEPQVFEVNSTVSGRSSLHLETHLPQCMDTLR